MFARLWSYLHTSQISCLHDINKQEKPINMSKITHLLQGKWIYRVGK